MNKEVKKIFLVLALYALSGGFFYNFQELWMADNKLSVQTIGTVFSLCALLSVSVIFLCSNLIDKNKLKKFTCILLLLKVIIIFILFLINNTGLNVLIKFLIMVDYVIDVEIYALIYPMITFITKNNKVYALRGLIYSYAYYAGVIITSIILGKTISNFNINYNFFCLIGSILMLIAYIIMRNTNLDKYIKKEDKEKPQKSMVLTNILKTIKKDRITQNYIGHILGGEISYNCINGLLIILLTNNIGFSPAAASTFKMVLGIVAVFIGTLILEKLTFKNDYINYAIKFIGRLFFYLLAFIFNNKIMFLIAIIYPRLLSESYSHVTDAPYVNRFSSENQLAFCNFKEMVKYLAKAIGNLMCSIFLVMGTKYIFLAAAIFITIQIYFGFKAINLRIKEKGDVNL